jgi:hypothetical protein
MLNDEVPGTVKLSACGRYHVQASISVTAAISPVLDTTCHRSVARDRTHLFSR